MQVGPRVRRRSRLRARDGKELLAVLLVTRRDDDLELGLEGRRRAPLSVMVDRDDVAAATSDEVEHVPQLAGPVGNEQPDREEAARLGEPMAKHRDERRGVDVPSREHDRDRARAGHATGEERSQADRSRSLDEELRPLDAEDERLRDLLVRNRDGVVEHALEDRRAAGRRDA